MRFKIPGLLLCLALVMAACSTTAETTTTLATTETPATTTAPTITSTTQTTVSPEPTTDISLMPEPSTTTSPPTTIAAGIEIVVADGSVTGPDRIEVALGETVEFTVVSDIADEVHVHGYDLFADVAPGTPGSFSFVADIPGIFEVELESAHTLITELLVQ